jgi:hypothetical protein
MYSNGCSCAAAAVGQPTHIAQQLHSLQRASSSSVATSTAHLVAAGMHTQRLRHAAALAGGRPG